MNLRTSLLALALLAAVTGAAAAQTAPFAFAVDADDPAAGETVTVTFSFENTDDKPVSGIVNVTALPADWSVDDRSDDGGVWNDDEMKWLFQSVPEGESVAPTLTLSVPDDASGEYDIVATATDGETTTEQAATVTVGSGEATEEADQATSDGSGPGFGVIAAVVALLSVAALARRGR